MPPFRREQGSITPVATLPTSVARRQGSLIAEPGAGTVSTGQTAAAALGIEKQANDGSATFNRRAGRCNSKKEGQRNIIAADSTLYK